MVVIQIIPGTCRQRIDMYRPLIQEGLTSRGYAECVRSDFQNDHQKKKTNGKTIKYVFHYLHSYFIRLSAEPEVLPPPYQIQEVVPSNSVVDPPWIWVLELFFFFLINNKIFNQKIQPEDSWLQIECVCSFHFFSCGADVKIIIVNDTSSEIGVQGYVEASPGHSYTKKLKTIGPKTKGEIEVSVVKTMP